MSKEKKIVDLKVDAINLVVRCADDVEEDFIKWVRAVASDKEFAALFIRRIDQLRDVCKTMKNRAERFGEVDEKILAKKFCRYFGLLDVRSRPLVGREITERWDRIGKTKKKALEKIAKKLLEEIFS